METVNKKKAGRKPGKDNKIPLTIYIEQSVVINIGDGKIDEGRDKAREVASQSVYDFNSKIRSNA